MTVDELIQNLQKLSAEGHGKVEVRSWSGDTIEPIDAPGIVTLVKRSRNQLWRPTMKEADRGRSFVML